MSSADRYANNVDKSFSDRVDTEKSFDAAPRIKRPKRLGEMTEDELQAYHTEARAYAEDKARDDLKREIARGNFPEIAPGRHTRRNVRRNL